MILNVLAGIDGAALRELVFPSVAIRDAKWTSRLHDIRDSRYMNEMKTAARLVFAWIVPASSAREFQIAVLSAVERGRSVGGIGARVVRPLEFAESSEWRVEIDFNNHAELGMFLDGAYGIDDQRDPRRGLLIALLGVSTNFPDVAIAKGATGFSVLTPIP